MTYRNTDTRAFPFMDMFFSMQKSYLDMITHTTRAMIEPAARSRAIVPFNVHKAQEFDVHKAQEQVIGIGEEVLAITTRRVPGAATRVRRVVSEVPVERRVELHDETITIERRPSNGSVSDDALSEREFVMIDTREVPVVSKHQQVREELVLRREVTGRIEMIHETLRHTDVEVEQPHRMPMVMPIKTNQTDEQHQKQH